MPNVSIIIPVYNAEKYIAATLESVFAQTYSDFECIIVDDGSSDNTLAVVRTFNDTRVKIVSQSNSGGPAKPRNKGIAAALGKYIFIFDSDDLMMTQKLKIYLDLFEQNKNVDVIFSDFQVIDEQDILLSESFLSDYESFRRICKNESGNVFRLDMTNFHEEIIKANFIGTSGVAFKSSVTTPVFDERFVSGDDILAWASLAKTQSFYFINMPLHQYRKREGSISSKNIERLLTNKIKILTEIASLCESPGAKAETIKKQNEYFYGLGYFYRSQKRYADAIRAYKAVKNIPELPKVLMAIIKVVIFKIRDFWSH
jgi:glycosyltransferase involved in cell wall biosynthesis